MSAKLRISLLLALALVASAPAYGSFITCRTGVGCLNGTDSFDWAQIGPESLVTGVPSPKSVTSNGGAPATIDDPNNANNEIFHLIQSSIFSGNFAPGDDLAYTGSGFPGPLVIDFATPVSGVGAQVQANFFGTFTGIISVFNSANVLLETYQLAGNSNGNADNSAIFMGVLRGTADIDRVEFSVSGAGNTSPEQQDMAINTLDFLDGAVQVPEPGTLALLGLGLAGLGLRQRKQ